MTDPREEKRSDDRRDRLQTNQEIIADAKKNNPTMMGTVDVRRRPPRPEPDMSVTNNNGVPGGMLDGSEPLRKPFGIDPDTRAPRAAATAPARTEPAAQPARPAQEDDAARKVVTESKTTSRTESQTASGENHRQE